MTSGGGCPPGLHLRAVLAERDLDVRLDLTGGEVLAVLGPNGAGKSTLLHIIAGLLVPDAGEVRLGERVLTDVDRGVLVATHDRRVGLLLQEPLLFPHLSVAGNVAFGMRARRRAAAPRQAIADETRHWLRQVGAAELADRRPARLSGGQQQRVAIARALAARPDLMLLDEPLAGLDVAAAAAVRAVLQQVVARERRTTVLITHDLVDVFSLADRVVVLEDGVIVESGAVMDVLTVPRSRFAAQLAGLNLVRGIADGADALRTSWGDRWCGTRSRGDLGTDCAEDWDATADRGGDAVAVFAPAAVAVSRDAPEPPAPVAATDRDAPRARHTPNRVGVTVAELSTGGTAVRLRAEPQPDGGPGLMADISADAAAALQPVPGERLWFSVAQADVTVRRLARMTAPGATGPTE